MALTVPLVSGEFLMLQYILGLKSINTSMTASSTQGPVLHLYSNDPTINNSTVIGSVNEVTSAGYAPITMVSTNWTTSQTMPSGITTGLYSQQTFTLNTNAVSFGYYVTDTLGALQWLERFSGAPFSLPDGGGSISISPRITLA